MAAGDPNNKLKEKFLLGLNRTLVRRSEARGTPLQECATPVRCRVLRSDLLAGDVAFVVCQVIAKWRTRSSLEAQADVLDSNAKHRSNRALFKTCTLTKSWLIKSV